MKNTKEFKRESVALAQIEGNSFKPVAQDPGIHIKTLNRKSAQTKQHGGEDFLVSV